MPSIRAAPDPLRKCQVFCDVFNADTGKKVFTLQTIEVGVGDSYGCLAKTGWLTTVSH